MRWRLLLGPMLGLVMLMPVRVQAQTSRDQAQAASTASPSRVHPPRAMRSNGSERSSAQPPAPGAVLEAIYHEASHGVPSYRIAGGGWATYWYGYAFELNGRHYYTGFAYDVPRGSDGPDDMPSPDTKASIAQATFESVGPEGAGPWSLVGAARRIGLFGGSGKGYAVDDARQPRSTPTSAGTLLLAVPAWYLATGTRVGTYELFLFDPNAQGARWRYLGNVEAGEDNGAACDEKDGGRIACVRSIGALDFVPQDGSDMPLVRLAMSGTAIDDSGKVRTLGPADAVEYRYDPGKQSYVTSPPCETDVRSFKSMVAKALADHRIDEWAYDAFQKRIARAEAVCASGDDKQVRALFLAAISEVFWDTDDAGIVRGRR